MKIYILLLNFLLPTTNIFSQTNESFYCSIQRSYIDHNVHIFENKKDNVIKIYSPDLNIVDHYVLNHKSVENSIHADTLSKQNPIDKVIDQNDKRIDFKQFSPVKFKEPGNEPNKVLFEKQVDFVGDALLDKIEITIADFEFQGKKPYLLKLYENKEKKYILYSNCSISLWDKPLKLYISKLRYLDMAVLLFLNENDSSDKTMLIEMIYADRVEK